MRPAGAAVLVLPDGSSYSVDNRPPTLPLGGPQLVRVTRHLPDGSIDESYGEGGHTDLDAHAFVRWSVVDRFGRLYLAGSAQEGDGGPWYTEVVRVTPDGELDPTYRRIRVPDQVDVGLAPDGAAVMSHPAGQSSRLERFDPDGRRDDRFGDVLLPGGAEPFPLPSGSVLVVSHQVNPDGTSRGVSVASRWTADGELDPSYRVTDIPYEGFAVLQPDGGLVLSRPHDRPDGRSTTALQRILPGGGFDGSFGGDGSVDPGARAPFRQVVVAPDGRLFLEGEIGVVRVLTPDGHAVESYGACGYGGHGQPLSRIVGVDGHGRAYQRIDDVDSRQSYVVRLQGRDGGPYHGPHFGSSWWVATAGGRVLDQWLACWHGDLRGTRLNRPVVGIEATPLGRGYWLAAADGGVFTFGDAPFLGSLGDRPPLAPIVAVAATPSGRGYWLAAADGGVFTFGDARFHGAAPRARWDDAPVTGMAARPDGRGYWLVRRDGTVHAFGAARHAGDATGDPEPVVGIASSLSGDGYVAVARNGALAPFGDAFVPNDRGSFVYSPAYSPGRVVGIATTAHRPHFERLFDTCCTSELGGERPVAFAVH